MNERHPISTEKLVERFLDGFYGWSGLKYFLFKMEGDNGLLWSGFEGTSIEHVIPQSATGENYDGWWTRQINEFAPYEGQWRDLGKEDKRICRQRRHTLVNSLGNLVLLTQSENASISDDPWEAYPRVAGKHKEVIGKKAFYADMSHTSSAGAREVAQIVGSWNAFHIRERGRKLFQKLAEMMGCGLLSSVDIDGALGFDNELNLQDSTFDVLPESEVNRLAPKLGTGAEPRVRKNNTRTNNGIRGNAMTLAQREEVLRMLKDSGIKGITASSYVPYPSRSADFFLFRGRRGNAGNLFLKEETPTIGFYGVAYETMRVWADIQLRNIIAHNAQIFDGWKLTIDDSHPKGHVAKWFTLSRDNNCPWYSYREEIVTVAAALYNVLDRQRIFVDDFDESKFKQ